MKCPLCDREIDVYSLHSDTGKVREWCGSCESPGHVIRFYAKTKKGVLEEWRQHTTSPIHRASNEVANNQKGGK